MLLVSKGVSRYTDGMAQTMGSIMVPWVVAAVSVIIAAGLGWMVYSDGNTAASPTPAVAIPDDAPPERGVVQRVLDPITVQLESGHIVRYIGVRAPSVTKPVECFGKEALLANESVVGKAVRLEEEPLLPRAQDGSWTRYVFFEADSTPLSPSPDVDAVEESMSPSPLPAAGPQPGPDADSTTGAEDLAPSPTPEGPEEIFVNERILEGGFGFPVVSQDMKYGERMLAAARFASATSKGLWGQCEIKEQSTPQGTHISTPALDDCVIKGNVTPAGEKLYRTPDCAAYAETIVIRGEGDEWFCAEDTAQESGFTKAPDCS